MPGRILIVDDEKAIRWSLGEALKNQGYEVSEADNGEKGIDLFREEPADLVILDLKLPDTDGIEVLKKLREEDEEIPVIMMTAYGEVETAVEAIKNGAYDFLLKPFQLEKMKIAIRHALENRRLREELDGIKKKEKEEYNFNNFLGTSKVMRSVFETVIKIGESRASTILIQGESGTGKELVARAIHESSKGEGMPFLEINCAALPESLLESELFGHEKGAFTDAKTRKKGLFELAEGGTIFLDEIGEMGITLQSRLLRVLENKTFRRVGGVKDMKVNTRIIAATNRDLLKAIQAGDFRNDLYYRLQVIPIYLPPLRERKEDIALLANHFIEVFSKEFKKKIDKINPEVEEHLMRYSWPGNVRELKNVIERAILLEAEKEILPEHIPSEIMALEEGTDGPGPEGIDRLYPISIKDMEKILICKTLDETDGNKSKAARILGISRQTLREKTKMYGYD
ncbi:MAG: sigma-54-dependent Fis family transcriptional regulator [Candidatus Krumholzibacteriota bacterium]|nr:sigma-54-dependent Fis family transcriptional regulator [Candidatus Krumholzibacteriota bacterium]